MRMPFIMLSFVVIGFTIGTVTVEKDGMEYNYMKGR